MCGRFMLDSEIRDIIESFKIENSFIESYNKGEFCPGSVTPVITEYERRTLLSGKWGFKAKESNKLIINARVETIFERPMFKNSMKSRRCIIPASAFYEWKYKKTGSKVKYEIESVDNKPLALGGIYNVEGDEPHSIINSFVIITTEANRSMAEIHHRMPVIIRGDYINTWLGNDYTGKNLTEIIESNKDVELQIREVFSNKPEQMSMF